ncbi:MAG: DHHA1 domain-containing protein [Candidatus Aenigmatarchaeota archaeon]
MQFAVNFLKSIKPTDEIVIIFNNDADGICACALINKFLEKTGRKRPYIISQPMPMDKNLIRRIQTTIPNKIIFLDLAVDQQQSILKKLGGICDILIIDHHQVYKNLSKKNVVHYNPRFKNKNIYQSTSYLVYKICSKIINMSEYLWIAAIGIVADYNLNDSKDLVNEIKNKYSIKKLEKSIFSQWSDMIYAVRATKYLSCEQIVYIIENVKNFENLSSIENYDKMLDAYQKISNETMSILSDIERNHETIGNIIFYNIKSKYNLSSQISTKLSEKYPDKLIITYEKNKNKIKVSARNQSNKIDAGKVLKLATKGLKASGGGHEAAAGATLLSKDWEKFKENLIKIVNK